MTISSFVLKNALRNKRRAVLSVMSVAVSLFLLVTLLVAVREFTLPPEDAGAAARVVVRNRISLANLLPARQLATIEKIEGVEAVTPFTWFGGKFRNEAGMSFAQFGVEPKAMSRVFGEARITDEEREDFWSDRTTCIIGKVSAEKFNLKRGDRITLQGTIWPCDLQLRIAGVYEGSLDDRNLFFHHKYLDESVGAGGQVGTWWVRVRSLEEVPTVVDRINKAFENTSAEVRAETERAFQLGFVSMWGNIKALIHSICTVVVFTLALVSASTMSMAVRERFRELAILKALGFRRLEIFGFILAESFALAFLGALLGAGGAWLLYSNINVAAMSMGMLVMFEVTPRILGIAFLVACGLGILSCIAPALSVSRMSVVSGLKTLD